MVQITVIRLLGYREWTLSLGFDREHVIQQVQAKLHDAVNELFSKFYGFAHPLRYDMMIALSNGITKDMHEEIYEGLSKVAPVPVAMGIASSPSPRLAESIASSIASEPGVRVHSLGLGGRVAVAHVDFAGLTEVRSSAYNTYVFIDRIRSVLMQWIPDSVVFYLGGDNMLVVLPDEFDVIILRSMSKALNTRIGIGISKRPRTSIALATKSLEDLRVGGIVGVKIDEEVV